MQIFNKTLLRLFYDNLLFHLLSCVYIFSILSTRQILSVRHNILNLFFTFRVDCFFRCTVKFNQVKVRCVASALQPTWWHIGEVAASQRFGRAINLHICTTLSAELHPPLRKTARWAQAVVRAS